MPRLYRTDIALEADLRIFVTDIRSEADLVAFRTDDAWAATEGPLWFLTDVRGEADRVVCFVDSRWDADLTVWFTDVQPDACWQSPEKSGLL